MAPGVDVLAAVAPSAQRRCNCTTSLCGTSMSSPHIAGIGAAHGGEAPDVVADGDQVGADDDRRPDHDTERLSRSPATPFAFGAGQVRPTSAARPGPGLRRRPAGLAAVRLRRRPVLAGDGTTLRPSADRPERPQLRRRSRSATWPEADGDPDRDQRVAARRSTLTADVQAPAGVTVNVTPVGADRAAGRNGTFKVDIHPHHRGVRAVRLRLADLGGLRGHSVRSPLAVRPVAISAPGSVSGTGAAGTATWKVTPATAAR